MRFNSPIVRIISACLLLFTCSLSFTCQAYAQSSTRQEAVSIVAYFPTPDGVFKFLRLRPSDSCGNMGSCSNPGEICYSQTNGKMLVCSPLDYDANQLRWQVDDIWSQSNFSQGTIYYGQLNRNYVGIGTNDPRSTMDLRNNTNICVRMAYYNNSGYTGCPPGYNTLTGRYTIAPTGAFGLAYFLCCRVHKDYRNLINDSALWDAWG